jgi:hypothetical protein
MAIDRVTARSGFIGEDQFPARLVQAAYRPIQRSQIPADPSMVSNLAAARAIGKGDLHRLLVNIQTNMDSDTLVHGLPPRMCVATCGSNAVALCACAHNPRYRGGRPLQIKPFCLALHSDLM